MRLYTYIPPKLLRINIKKQGVKTEFLTICECEQQEFYDYVKKLIENQKLSIFQEGNLTNIQIRTGEGKENGKSVSLSFKGLEPAEVAKLITEDLDKKQENFIQQLPI